MGRPARSRWPLGWGLALLLLSIAVLTGCQAPPPAATPTGEPAPLAQPPAPAAPIEAPTTPPTAVPATSTLVAAVVPPTPAPTEEATPEPPELERMRVVTPGDQGTNLRRDPGTGSPVLRTVPNGAEVTIVGPDRDSDGRLWRMVDYEGLSGWVVVTALRSPPTPTATPNRPAASPTTETPTPTATPPGPVISAPAATTPGPTATEPPQPAADAEQVEVTGTGGQGANLRADPSLSGRLIQNVRDGTRLTIVGEDRQAEGRTWRNVQTESGAVGWLVADALRTLATSTPTPGPTATPAPTPTPGATASPGATPAPAGTPPPAAEAPAEPTPEPERVEVFEAGANGANLRRDPGTRGFVIKSVPDGSQWTIVGPDRDVDGKTWRNVQGEDGTTGWLAAEVVRSLTVPTPTPRPGAPGIGAPREAEEAEDTLTDEERAATPCRPGQIKGDASTGSYYLPDHPDYAGLKLRVRCFDAESQARASGYLAAGPAPAAAPSPEP